jgi:hypothetical protein
MLWLQLAQLGCFDLTRCFQVPALVAQRSSFITSTRRHQSGILVTGLLPRFGVAVFSGTLPMASGRRHFGFFSILKQKLQEEFDKNEDFRSKVKTAQETDAMKKAAEAAAATKVGALRGSLLPILHFVVQATAESAAIFGAAAAEKVASKVGEAATAASAG